MATPPLDWKDLYDNISRPDTVLGVATILGGVLFMIKKILNAAGLDIVKKDGAERKSLKPIRDLEPRLVRLESTIVGLEDCVERQKTCRNEIERELVNLSEKVETGASISQANAVVLGEVKTAVDFIREEIRRIKP
ncbi:MAG: hypothetical protein PHC68_00310 [Syntrophorhabdaceae bacterium]|nr:hypothetical protein [Syntrophorhabdaceae bacterium]